MTHRTPGISGRAGKTGCNVEVEMILFDLSVYRDIKALALRFA
jgi:hypothetical protein